MPSDQELQAVAEEWKSKGNDAFQKSELEAAVQAYSQGLVQVDRLITSPVLLKATLLSNRAACYLKQAKLRECHEDCSAALTLLEKENDTKLRGKLLYRRAKALFMRANMPHKREEDDLQLAAKDLMSLISFDPSNKEGLKLLNTIRAQHAQESKNLSNSPMAKTVLALKKKDDKILHNLKVILGMLNNDSTGASMELGRLQGVKLMLDEISMDETLEVKVRYLALQCLSCAGSHPPFCRSFMKEGVQEKLSDMIVKSCNLVEEDDIVVGALTVYLRLILHLDRDDPDKDVDGFTLLEYNNLVRGLVACLGTNNLKIVRATVDVLSSWTAGPDRDNIIRASLDNYVDLPVPKTQYELHQMTPQNLNKYKQRNYKKRTRDQAWAFDRAGFFLKNGGLEQILKTATSCGDTHFRREITVIMGKVLAALEAEAKIKEAVQAYFVKTKPKKENDQKESNLGPVIEEVEDDEEVGVVSEVKESEEDKKPAPITHELMMERAQLATALLMANGEAGAWAIGSGWPTCQNDLNTLVELGEKTALCLVAEVMSAAASVKDTRPIVASYLSNTSMKSLVNHPDRDVRTAAASSVAKLGLAEQGTEEIEIIGLMEAACYMLEDVESEGTKNAESLSVNIPSSNKTGATTSVERGVEVMAYLASKTLVKEELAHGFKATPESERTGLELLVQVADMPSAGESLMAFGLASIFQLTAVTPLTLRKEAFDDKPMTMEQYDEIQAMQKTEDEKEIDSEPELQEDSPEQCASRIVKMVKANVPRALIQLTENASEQTLQEIIVALNRFANEVSVRGLMIQQGVLSAMIKLEKEEKTPTDAQKKVIRSIRHCMAKMLVTTNPGLLTSAQRMGAIKPLIQLVRDVDSSDFQKFESLMALTNIAAAGDDTKNKIVIEKGLSTIKFAMFADHEMVRKAATECLCNLVPNPKFMEKLRELDELRLWLALASDFEEHYECARAAAGCLAMATQDPEISKTLISIKNFKERMDTCLQSGSLEIMHRVLVIVLNLAELGGKYRAAAEEHGLLAFARAYAQEYHDGAQAGDLEFGEEEKAQLNATVEVAKQVVRAADA
mmetsp:Transcript_118831/g.177624  ORF Transcript_118831/g.177624 Transcript_118831/m.177624 type:complete len:1074 (+) Transcript_118831:108-3329(+)